MKLYNLFESVILEEIVKQRNLLTEGVSDEAVKDSIANRYWVRIKYQDYVNEPPSERTIEVYGYGITSAGNHAVRAYQKGGGSKTQSNGWKLFRTDRIVDWSPTNKKWYNPVSDYDESIPTYRANDKLFAHVIAQVDPNEFQKPRSDVRQAPVQEPKQNPLQEPVQAPIPQKPETSQPMVRKQPDKVELKPKPETKPSVRQKLVTKQPIKWNEPKPNEIEPELEPDEELDNIDLNR